MAGHHAAEAFDAAAEHGFPLYRAAAAVVGGWARTQEGNPEGGLVEIDQGISDYAATGAEMWLPYFLALKAEALANAGRSEDGLGCIRQGLQRVERTQGHWIEAELHRLQAKLSAEVDEN